MKIPKISIIIPVYNVQDYLAKCLDSVIQQSLDEIEIIVINDESTDDSFNIIQAYASKDSRIIIIDQKNKGLGGARNSGIEIATGEYLFFLDSDDHIEQNTMQQLYRYATDNTLDLVVFNYTKVDEKNIPITTTDFGDGILSKDEIFRKILSLKTSPQAWNKLYKRHLFVDHNIRYPEKFLHEDLPVTYELFWYAEKIGYMKESFYYWLTRRNSITQKFTFQHINDISSSLLQIKQFLLEHDSFEKYKLEYIRGSMQMLNILMERSILFIHQGTALMTYVKYIIDSNKIVNQSHIESLSEFDLTLYNKFIKNYRITSQTLQNNKPVETCTTQLLNYLLPKHSRRRVLIKKILRRG